MAAFAAGENAELVTIPIPPRGCALRWLGGLCFGFAGVEARQRGGRLGRGKFQLHAPAIYLAARAHAFDDFLAGVAAFGEADVRGFQRRLRAESQCR